MRRTLLALTIVAGAVGGMTLAHHDEHGKGGEYVKVLSEKEKTKATTVEVTEARNDEAHLLGSPVIPRYRE